MNISFEILKSNKHLVRKVLVCISVFFAILTTAMVFGSAVDSARVPGIIAKALSQDNNEGQALEECMKKNKGLADKLKKKNMFVESKPPKVPVCTGILGDSAFIDNQWRKAGEKFGSCEVVAVGTGEVTIMMDGKEKILKPFGEGVGNSPSGDLDSKKRKPGRRRERRGGNRQENPESSRRRGFGRGGGRMSEYLSSFSDEEREEMRERIQNMSREERREFFRQRRENANPDE